MSDKLKKYRKSTLVIFEVIGSYFVDVFYNKQYLLAVSQSKILQSTITELYYNNLITYVSGLTKSNDCFKQSVLELHKYSSIGLANMLLSDMQDSILSEFIPAEFYPSFTDSEKDKTLREILVYSANELLQYILQNKIFTNIIDDHKNEANIVLLQDYMLHTLAYKREEYYTIFAKNMQEPRELNNDLIMKLKHAYVSEKRSSLSLRDDLNTAIKIIEQLREANVKFQNDLKNQYNICQKYEDQLRVLEYENTSLQMELRQLKAAKVEEPKIEPPKLEDPPLDISESVEQTSDTITLQGLDSLSWF